MTATRACKSVPETSTLASHYKPACGLQSLRFAQGIFPYRESACYSGKLSPVQPVFVSVSNKVGLTEEAWQLFWPRNAKSEYHYVLGFSGFFFQKLKSRRTLLAALAEIVHHTCVWRFVEHNYPRIYACSYASRYGYTLLRQEDQLNKPCRFLSFFLTPFLEVYHMGKDCSSPHWIRCVRMTLGLALILIGGLSK